MNIVDQVVGAGRIQQHDIVVSSAVRTLNPFKLKHFNINPTLLHLGFEQYIFWATNRKFLFGGTF
jgi:hypothetical protein